MVVNTYRTKADALRSIRLQFSGRLRDLHEVVAKRVGGVRVAGWVRVLRGER